jgi:hypothetical protein
MQHGAIGHDQNATFFYSQKISWTWYIVRPNEVAPINGKVCLGTRNKLRSFSDFSHPWQTIGHIPERFMSIRTCCYSLVHNFVRHP